MKNIIALAAAIVLLVVGSAWKTQDHVSDPKVYFGSYLDKNTFETMAFSSLPDLDQCKKVFTDSAAQVYFTAVTDMKQKFNAAGRTLPPTEQFVEVGYETFTTEDIKAGKGNYAGGMEGVKSFLQPGTTFYKIELLRQKGATQGMAYNCWVYISGRWTFFPKPWRVFKG